MIEIIVVLIWDHIICSTKILISLFFLSELSKYSQWNPKQLFFWHVCVCSYMCFVTDEVAQVAMLHVGQNHQWRALRRKADSQQRENVGMTKVLHDDPFFQELGHLIQVCDTLKKQTTTQRTLVYATIMIKTHCTERRFEPSDKDSSLVFWHRGKVIS